MTFKTFPRGHVGQLRGSQAGSSTIVPDIERGVGGSNNMSVGDTHVAGFCNNS